MKSLSMMDTPIVLSTLALSEKIGQALEPLEQLFPISIEFRDLKGVLLSPSRDMDWKGADKRAFQYQGEILGYVYISAQKAAEVEPIFDMAIEIIRALVHSAYTIAFTTAIHESEMSESSAELRDRNRKLESALDRLVELENLKSNFLATISHELRTPLTSIIGYSEMLNEGLAGKLNGEQKEYAETILSKSEQLLQLITGILDVSLIEAKSLRLTLKPVDLPSVLVEVAASLGKDLERRNIVFTLMDKKVPRVMADDLKLRQVLLHLLANAIKFSPKDSHIKVEMTIGPLSPDDSSVPESPFWRSQLSKRFGLRVSIRDQGIGIPDEQHAAIFEPFFQGDSGTTRAYGGTGLGLSLAKSYIEAHGGALWLEKGSKEKGSAFTFTLPAVDAEMVVFMDKQAAEISEASEALDSL